MFYNLHIIIVTIVIHRVILDNADRLLSLL